jgi:probable HAF family extracellular repeat protein
MRYSIEDLGELSAGLGCEGEGIDPHGIVVGSASLPGFIHHAIVRYPDGVVRDLGTLGSPAFSSDARGINSGGYIVGAAIIDTQYTSHAFLLPPGGKMLDLGTLAHRSFAREFRGIDAEEQATLSFRQEWRAAAFRTTYARLFPEPISSAEAINDLNQVVGFADVAPVQSHAFFYSEQQGMVDLGTLGGENSWAFDINNSHYIVGSSWTANRVQRAFLHFGSSPLTLADMLPTLGGAEGVASAINERGDVAGYSDTVVPKPGDSTLRHAFLFRDGAISDLGTLGGLTSYARAISNSGVVVGNSLYAPGNSTDHAFVWTAGQMLDLNELISAASGWVLRQGLGINDLGQITGWGYLRDQPRGFLLTPV